MPRIGVVGDRASEGWVAGVYGTGCTSRSLIRVRPAMKVSSDKELMEVGRKQTAIEGGGEGVDCE
jgi:hypothetical protein